MEENKEQQIKEEIAISVKDFKFPKYEEIPNVGLFLEQVAKYISEYLAPLGITITGSMISNYVKKKIVDNPVKKQYNREQIAYLIFIAVSKSVLSLENIQLFIQIQKKTYKSKVAYEYFCEEFENILYYVFGLKDNLDEVGVESTDTKLMLRNTIITIVYKVYIDRCFIELEKIKEEIE